MYCLCSWCILKSFDKCFIIHKKSCKKLFYVHIFYTIDIAKKFLVHIFNIKPWSWYIIWLWIFIFCCHTCSFYLKLKCTIVTCHLSTYIYIIIYIKVSYSTRIHIPYLGIYLPCFICKHYILIFFACLCKCCWLWLA